MLTATVHSTPPEYPERVSSRRRRVDEGDGLKLVGLAEFGAFGCWEWSGVCKHGESAYPKPSLLSTAAIDCIDNVSVHPCLPALPCDS